MSPNLVLLWTVGAASAVALIRLLRLRAEALGGWIAVNLLLLGVVGLGLLLFPEVAGFVSFALWATLVLVPGLASRFIHRLTLAQRYGPARRMMLVIRWLHPLDGWLRQPELLRALELASAGDLATAEAILDRFRDDTTSLGHSARVHLFRVRGQWEQLRSWIDTTPEGRKIVGVPSFLPSYLRGLGETGDLRRLWRVYEESRAALSAPALAPHRTQCRLMVLSFLGQRPSVERLFQGPLSAMPSTHRQFWLATADMASGNVEPARALLEGIRGTCDPVVGVAIDRRLARPPELAAPHLADARPLLEQLDRDILEEERFGEHHASHGKPRLTLALLVANVLGFLLEVAHGSTDSPDVLFRLGALQARAVMGGEWWRILAAQFLHSGTAHLVLNGLGLIVLGRYLEFALGRGRYLAVYLLSGTGAMILLVLTHLSESQQDQLFVGASGGIMGLIGATAAVMLTGWRRERAQLARQRLSSIVLILGLQSFFDISMPQVSFIAHVSGAAIGFLTALVLKHRIASKL
ncbi:MAG: rhomboid family intramembrane serine protease [Hyalangium sp.]|uniref:rhomboid family intramembrane serine protease n=1 Tax=Hyalangium sp. TaxID=2028555 RepID=UPI00389A9FCA